VTKSREQTRAAEIWAGIERELLANGLPPDRFTVPRARFIRMIGAALNGREEPPQLELRPPRAASVVVEKCASYQEDREFVNMVNLRLDNLIVRRRNRIPGMRRISPRRFGA
jgi:hypothetical protein